MVADGLEVDAERIRPLPLARRWGVPERHVIEACLEATRLGMLELRWDLLCPRCRGAKVTAGTLDQIPTGAHCGTCNIDYARNFSRNVELVLRPSPVDPADRERRVLPARADEHAAHLGARHGRGRARSATSRSKLAPGPYRLRTLEFGPEADIEYDGGPFPAVVVTDGWVLAGPPSPPGRITLRNRSSHRRTFVVEERRWIQDALTADRMATLQAFRDLFSAEVLRPGDEVAIGRVTLLFSDLKGSTAMYEAVGDAAAYRLVRAHFAYLAAIVREHDGAIVKTIGDAVMAAFHEPAAGAAGGDRDAGARGRVQRQEPGADRAQARAARRAVHRGHAQRPARLFRADREPDRTAAGRERGRRRRRLGPAGRDRWRAGAAGPPSAAATESALLRGVSEPVGFVRLTIGPA